MSFKIKEKDNKKLSILEIMLTSLSIFTFALLVISIVSPIMFNFKEVNFIGKILMILGTILSFSLLVSLIFINMKTKNAKKFNFICIMILFFFVWGMSIIHYINFTLWGIKLDFWISFIIIVFLIGSFANVYDVVKGTSKNLVIDILLAVNLVIYLIGFISFLVSKSWLYIQIGIGFSYVLMLIYFINKFLIKKEKLVEKKYLPILTQVLIITVLITTTIFTFPVYINWIGLQSQAFNHFITIYSCLVGGLITLCGVSWTIKNQEKIRQEDHVKFQEKENLMHKPYFSGYINYGLKYQGNNIKFYNFANVNNKQYFVLDSDIKNIEKMTLFFIYRV